MRHLIVVIGILLAGCESEPRCQLLPPAVQLLDLEGRPAELWTPNAITVVLFTRTNCPIANRLAPEFARLYETYHTKGVEFVLVFVDPREDAEHIQKHLQDYHLPGRALRDPKHSLASRCGATATPEAAVFNVKCELVYCGRVNDLYTDLGKPRAEATTHDLAHAIDATLNGRPVAVPRTKAFGCLIDDLK